MTTNRYLLKLKELINFKAFRIKKKIFAFFGLKIFFSKSNIKIKIVTFAFIDGT
jgi:tmRNA-binding protein